MALPPETKVPSIPNPASDPEGFLRAVQEVVQVREGARGNPLDRGVTFRDLVDAGMAAPNPAFAGKGRIPASALITPTGVRPAMTVPPKPRDVVAVGTFTSILITWAQPDYSNHAHAEILRAAVNDIGQAVTIGSSVGRQYADAVGTDADYYYWVRYVSTGNVKGQASASVRGKTALDPQYVMANLLSTTWQPNTAYTEFQYVRPTVDNGLMYRCTQDGTSGATEPVWPTVIGGIRTDGTVKWTTVAQTERVPFTIGTVNGQPAVVMDTAYIADATITVAKIKDAFLDNLTAIHGTLNFARIEQGNIFELTIGGDIRSETFSPFYNTGFIIRNEPGRDPNTPTLRKYTAEFYGDTLFSGDVRAARILSGMIVGSIYGVPSDADNGSFEYISRVGVVSDSVSADRADSYGNYTVQVSGWPLSGGSLDPNLQTKTLSLNTYDGYIGTDYAPFSGPKSGQIAPATKRAHDNYSTYYNKTVFYEHGYLSLAAIVYNTAVIITNPLKIISYNATAPFNYNRYKRRNINCEVMFNRISNPGFRNMFYSDGSDPLYTNLFVIGSLVHTGFVVRIKVGSRLLASVNVFESGGINKSNGYDLLGAGTRRNTAGTHPFSIITPTCDITGSMIITISGGVTTRRLSAGTKIVFKNIPFSESSPTGIHCEIASVTRVIDDTEYVVASTAYPAGLDIGFTFSSTMNNSA